MPRKKTKAKAKKKAPRKDTTEYSALHDRLDSGSSRRQSLPDEPSPVTDDPELPAPADLHQAVERLEAMSLDAMLVCVMTAVEMVLTLWESAVGVSPAGQRATRRPGDVPTPDELPRFAIELVHGWMDGEVPASDLAQLELDVEADGEGWELLMEEAIHYERPEACVSHAAHVLLQLAAVGDDPAVRRFPDRLALPLAYMLAARGHRVTDLFELQRDGGVPDVPKKMAADVERELAAWWSTCRRRLPFRNLATFTFPRTGKGSAVSPLDTFAPEEPDEPPRTSKKKKAGRTKRAKKKA